MAPGELLNLAEEKLRELVPGASLKAKQRSVLAELLAGRHVFAALPTGYGKSLCYWLPATAWTWRIWVVSPLISLMEDQLRACRELGIPAVALHSGASASEEELGSGNWKILFVSPERLGIWWENGTYRRLRDQGLGPRLLVLDEMHCFEEWRKFRAGYQSTFAPIRQFAEAGGQILGLSASFSRENSDLWMREFCGSYARVESSLGRDNLSLLFLPIAAEHWRWLVLVAFLRGLEAPESALLYCSTREECDRLCAWLTSAGYPAVSYHAGLPSSLRRERSRAFRLGHLRIICATSAFGMGIDYPDVGRVLHFSSPHDLESYWQEVGRGGRNGREAVGLALLRRSDLARIDRMDEEQRERFRALWRSFFSGGCRKQAIAERLGIDEKPCGKCDQCRQSGEREFPAPVRGWEFLFRESAWWAKASAEPLAWMEKKIARAKALDDRSNPDSV